MLKRFLLCVCIIILSMTSSVYAADWVQLDVKLYADNSSIKNIWAYIPMKDLIHILFG